MSEVIWVSAITAIAALLGATVGSLTNFFGPAWQDRQRRIADHERAKEDTRYSRAEAMIEGFSHHYAAEYQRDTAELEMLRLRFVATLRPGEGPVDDYTRVILDEIRTRKKDSIGVAAAAGSQLFAWLRGDISIDQLELVDRAAH